MKPDPRGLAHSQSPVDLPEPTPPLPGGLCWTSHVIAVATLVLALLNAHALLSWANRLPPSATSVPLAVAAERWHEATQAAGLDLPGAILRDWWKRARDARFGDQASSDAPASRNPSA